MAEPQGRSGPQGTWVSEPPLWGGPSHRELHWLLHEWNLYVWSYWNLGAVSQPCLKHLLRPTYFKFLLLLFQLFFLIARCWLFSCCLIPCFSVTRSHRLYSLNSACISLLSKYSAMISVSRDKPGGCSSQLRAWMLMYRGCLKTVGNLVYTHNPLRRVLHCGGEGWDTPGACCSNRRWSPDCLRKQVGSG